MRNLILVMILIIIFAFDCNAQVVSPSPSLLNFQGRLTRPDGTPVADRNYAIQFSLYSAATGGMTFWDQTLPAVVVKNGVFAALLNVGTGFRNGATAATLFNSPMWLEIKVGTDAPLTPRQQLVSVAYAMKANTVPNGAIGTQQIADNAVTTAKIADAAITADKIASSLLNLFSWQLGGNGDTNPASHFLGTTNNQPLNVRVNNHRAMRYSYGEYQNGALSLNYRGINVLGGVEINEIGAGIVGATVAGGGQDNVTGVDAPNRVLGEFGTVGGGLNNTAGQAGGFYTEVGATVGGGYGNIAHSIGATVGGGRENLATHQYTTIAGGYGNSVTFVGGTIGGGQHNIANATNATLGGGFTNLASGSGSTIGGGAFNTASGISSTIPGGTSNAATGAYTFAAGRRAIANNIGSFVWADSTNADFTSGVADQFNVRASGGVQIYTNAALTSGVTLLNGDSSWNVVSDRNAKTAFQPVDVVDVLEKLVALPLTTWNYKSNADIRHMGLMAQDFHAAFGGLGVDNKHISSVDADGVAFAAIQGIYRKLEAKEKRLQKVEAENAELRVKSAELDTLKTQVEILLQRVEQLEQNRK